MTPKYKVAYGVNSEISKYVSKLGSVTKQWASTFSYYTSSIENV